MISSTVAIFITVASILVVFHYVQKLEFARFQSSGVKLYLARAGVGIVPVILLSTLLFFLLSL